MTKGKTFETNKQGVTITKDTVEGLMETVRNLYLADDIPVSYTHLRAFERAGANVITKVFKNMSATDILDSVSVFEKDVDKRQVIWRRRRSSDFKAHMPSRNWKPGFRN